MRRKKAVFLDRDGTVIVDRGYLDSPAGVALLPGAGAALRRLADLGFRLVLVTNQSGVGRGFFSLHAVERQHARLQNLLAPFGVVFDAVEVCPHHPDDACRCRKPAPELLLRAALRCGLEPARSYMIGDKPSDVGAGRAAGCTTLYIGSDCPEADARVPDLAAAADWIAQREKETGDAP